MGSSSRFQEIFAAEPQAVQGVPFARFMELALYHPEVGYYARNRRRIGRDRQSDFYTAPSLGPVFGELVVAAAVALLGGLDPREFTFVEIGTERDGLEAERTPPGGVLSGVNHPFAGAWTVSLGQPVILPSRSVVFSNELFDALPFHRLVRRDGAWRERGVAWREPALLEVELPALTAEVAALAGTLPADACDGYCLDLPLRSAAFLRQIAAQSWRGLFLALDYGKSWRELSEECPQGTARGYLQHRQTGHLLARPGEQDLTCHVCWDWLAEALATSGFGAVVVESQESFFARHSSRVLQAVIVAEATRFSPRKQALQQLLHPAQMGQKFQALHALRE